MPADKATKDILIEISRDRRDSTDTGTRNAFDVFLWAGDGAYAPCCVVSDTESFCYVGFRYTSYAPLVSSELRFEVSAQKRAVRFQEGDVPIGTTWRGCFEGVRPYITLQGRDPDQEIDSSRLEVVDRGISELLNGIFIPPAQLGEGEPTEINLRIRINTA